ncbi:MAG: histidinol dehydrogenase [Myxococcota bacterium]
MIIPSIDIQDGQTVQLIGGAEHALSAGDPCDWARRFGLVGEVAVVDLDAAMAQGNNRDQIAEVCRLAQVRVGGGIRSLDAARAWLDLGADRIVIGTAASRELLSELPRARVIAALDAVEGEVVVDGWKTKTGARIEDRMAELRDVVGGFLVTFVEKEGRMGGTAMDRVAPLLEAAGDARLTIAGGVTTPEEIAALDAMGVDAQVGMALYTGKLGLAEAIAACLKTDRDDGLWRTIVVDAHGRALGQCFSNLESLRTALESRTGVYWSRRRGLWRKGASSGHTQRLLRIDADCDRDSLRFTVAQEGPGFCHLDTESCWGPLRGLPDLAATLVARKSDAPAGSYTRRLYEDPELLKSKLVEEAGELSEARAHDDVVHETADVLYFAMVAMARAGVTLPEVEAELDRRAMKVSRRRGDAKTAPSRSRVTEDAIELGRLSPDAVTTLARDVIDRSTLEGAGRIVRAVQTEGDAALHRFGEAFGELKDHPLVYDREALARAREDVDADTLALLERTAARIERFARAQRDAMRDVEIEVDGGHAGHRVLPVARAGCYAPGGRYPLPSSVLMTAVTARSAGVAQVWVASPKPSPVTLAAAAVAGADALLSVGGAHAIAAFAYGTETVPKADVIAGPGNRWVTAAKQLVVGEVGIDMLAGPSELLVLASGDADPATVAADLLAQAEHDPDALPVLVTLDAALVPRVEKELVAQLRTLPSADIARTSLRSGFAVVVDDDEAAVTVCDRLAPEHLQLSGEGAVALAPRLQAYGGLFVGEISAEVLGDYGAGPNHTLPTGGTARFSAGLSVYTFIRARTFLRLQTAAGLAPDAADLARLEGLEAHARAAERRR